MKKRPEKCQIVSSISTETTETANNNTAINHIPATSTIQEQNLSDCALSDQVETSSDEDLYSDLMENDNLKELNDYKEKKRIKENARKTEEKFRRDEEARETERRRRAEKEESERIEEEKKIKRFEKIEERHRRNLEEWHRRHDEEQRRLEAERYWTERHRIAEEERFRRAEEEKYRREEEYRFRAEQERYRRFEEERFRRAEEEFRSKERRAREEARQNNSWLKKREQRKKSRKIEETKLAESKKAEEVKLLEISAQVTVKKTEDLGQTEEARPVASQKETQYEDTLETPTTIIDTSIQNQKQVDNPIDVEANQEENLVHQLTTDKNGPGLTDLEQIFVPIDDMKAQRINNWKLGLQTEDPPQVEDSTEDQAIQMPVTKLNLSLINGQQTSPVVKAIKGSPEQAVVSVNTKTSDNELYVHKHQNLPFT